MTEESILNVENDILKYLELGALKGLSEKISYNVIRRTIFITQSVIKEYLILV